MAKKRNLILKILPSAVLLIIGGFLLSKEALFMALGITALVAGAIGLIGLFLELWR